jgi:hypothetical protein
MLGSSRSPVVGAARRENASRRSPSTTRLLELPALCGPDTRLAVVRSPLSVVPLCDRRPMLTINCEECVMQHTAACDDCVVTFVVNREPGEALVIDVAEERAVRLLARAGLVPRLRHVAG